MTRPDFMALTLSSLLLVAGTGTAAVAAPKGQGHGAHHACHGQMMRGHAVRISVVGQGEAVTQPDMATINLGVTSQAATAAEAMQQNSTQQGAVIDALVAAGVEDRDIQTSGLNLSPMMDYSREGQAPRISGYQAQNIVTVRVRDLDGLGATLDALVTAGANEINGISFGRDDADQVQDDARRDAVADARHRAEIMAEAAGLTLGPVLTMKDLQLGRPGPEPMMMREAMAASDQRAVPVRGGELSMQSQVQIDFALIDPARMVDCGSEAGDDDGAQDDAVEPVVPGAPEPGVIDEAEAEAIMEGEAVVPDAAGDQPAEQPSN